METAIRRNIIHVQKQNQRHINVTNKKLSYEGDGKTTLNILNKEADQGLMINGISQVGFRLNNDMTVLGPMAIFPRTVLSWSVADLDDITEESLTLFSMIEPKIDMLVLGVGDKLTDLSFQKRMFPIMRKFKMTFEILATEQACATFNFLSSEGRYVAGAMIPPLTLTTNDDDALQTKMRYQNLYEVE